MVGIAVSDMVGLGVEGFPMPICKDYSTTLRPEGGLTKTQGPWETGARMQLRHKNKEDGQPADDGFVPATPTDKGSLRFPYGQISDDTQCSRELADSIIAAGRFSVQSFTDKLVELHSTVGVIGQGPTSRATLDSLQEGASWFEGSDAKPDALTNGSIMRVGPIGLLAWRDPTSQAAWANGVLSSHVTHQAPLCKEACAALGVAVAAAVRAKTRGDDPVTAVLDALEHSCPYTDYRAMLSAMLEAGPELQPALDAMHAVVPQSDLFKTQGYDFADRFFHGEVTMFPPHSAGFAIYGFLRTPDDFWESIFACIEVGGDTDTVAAMCGALAGAYAGYKKIASSRPDAGFVLSNIQDTASPGTADVSALRALAVGMYKVSVGGASKL
jgi:ADP-ribosylglycohydrolase